MHYSIPDSSGAITLRFSEINFLGEEKCPN